MLRHKSVTHAFEDLSQSLRVLLEADYKANRDGLLFVDRAEAVGNIETALSSVFNAFHSLHDACDKVGIISTNDWYETPELAVVLALRNARHHNKANKIRTIYTYHVQEAQRIDAIEQYVFIDFPASEEGADTIDCFISWADALEFLLLPRKERRISDSTAQRIREYLGSDRFRQFADAYQLPESRVFFNVVPLFVNAAAIVVPKIVNVIDTASTESKTFAMLFESMEPADTKSPQVDAGPFLLPS